MNQPDFRLAVVAVLSVMSTLSVTAAEIRSWRSADGRYSVQAELVRETSAGVALRKVDGSMVTVPLASLSAVDRRFVERIRAVDRTPALAADEFGDAIDLMPLVDVNTATKGSWQREAGGLVSGREARTQLSVDYRMPDKFQLRMKIQVVEGSDTLALGIPIGGQTALVMVDSDDGKWTGIDEVSGLSLQANETTYRRRAIDDNGIHDLLLTVLKGHVGMKLDGQVVLHWFGQPRQLRWDDQDWEVGDFADHTLVLATLKTRWKIHAMDVRPVLASRLNEVPFSSDNEGIRRSIALIETDAGSGSGFVAGHGLVATNHHVIADATVGEMRVYFGDDSDAVPVKRVLASSKKDDLAILQVDTDCKPLPIAWDGVIPKAETVHVHGNPAIDGGVLLRGASVQGRLQSRLRMEGQDYLQIAANVNPGSSGGPVLNESGQVIGVIVMKATGDGESFLRDASRRFDNSGGADPTVARRGVALAVPGQTLNEMLDQVAGVTNDQANQVSIRHDTRAVVNRCFIVAGYDFLRLLGNASRQIIIQAQSVGAGREKSPMPPVQVWGRLQLATRSDAFQRQLASMRSSLDGQLDELLQPDYGTHPNLGALRELNSQMKRLKKAADMPPTNYVKYERVVTDFSEKLERLSNTLLKTGDE